MNKDSSTRRTVHHLRDRLRHATEQEILSAAEQVLAEEGLAGANMQAIAERAGIAVGTIYNYFRDREALVAALLRARRDAFQERLRDCGRQCAGASFREKLTASVRAILQEFDEHRLFFRAVMEADRWPAAAGRAKGEPPTAAQQIEDCARKLVACGLREKVLRREKAELYPAMLAGILRGLFVTLLRREGFKYADLTDFVVAAFLEGARARP